MGRRVGEELTPMQESVEIAVELTGLKEETVTNLLEAGWTLRKTPDQGFILSAPPQLVHADIPQDLSEVLVVTWGNVVSNESLIQIVQGEQ